MARKLIGEEGSLTFAFGVIQSDGTVNWGTDVNLMAWIKNWKVNEGGGKADTVALGDTLKTSAPTQAELSASFDAMVPSTGRQFAGKYGTPIKMTFKANGALTGAGTTYQGWVGQANYEMPDGAQMEAVSINIGLNI